MGGEFVLVRTRDAGVHCGELAEYGDGCVLLRNARRVWRWRGANSLSEMSLRGAAEEYTRISEPVERITLIGVIEILYPTPVARANLERSRWAA